MRFVITRSFHRFRLLAVFALLALGAGSALAEVPAAVQSKLSRGINLSFWFANRDNPKIEPRLFWPDRSDLAQLRSIGFRHVRIPLERAWIADPRDPSKIDPAHADEFARAVELVAANQLLAVVTLTTTTDDLDRMLTDKPWRDTVAALWWSLARQLSARVPADKLVFEVINEPATENAAASVALMQTLAGAVRDAAPRHTIVVAGHKYSSVDELVTLKPFLDTNLVYSFHFYEPMNFTHQGAWWGWPMWAKLRGLPYPSTEALVAPLLASLDADAQPHARYYGQQEWNRGKLAAILDKVAQWQAQNGVPAWCSEFGAVKTNTAPASRQAWLRDTRTLLEQRRIPWTHFDFSQHMGIVDGAQGERVWDRGALEALGLGAPRSN